MSFIHSSAVWCWMMKSISSSCEARPLRREQRGKLQVAAVRRVGGGLGDVAGSSLLMR